MGIKIICHHKRATFDYELLEKIEAGLMLQGTEVKTLRKGKANINEAFVMIDDHGEAWLHQLSIPQYEQGNIHNHDEFRKRKLLLHAHQIAELSSKAKIGGLVIIPLQLYFKDSKAKVQIALAKGKKLYDKRQAQADKDVKRNLQRGNFEN